MTVDSIRAFPQVRVMAVLCAGDDLRLPTPPIIRLLHHCRARLRASHIAQRHGRCTTLNHVLRVGVELLLQRPSDEGNIAEHAVSVPVVCHEPQHSAALRPHKLCTHGVPRLSVSEMPFRAIRTTHAARQLQRSELVLASRQIRPIDRERHMWCTDQSI